MVVIAEYFVVKKTVAFPFFGIPGKFKAWAYLKIKEVQGHLGGSVG